MKFKRDIVLGELPDLFTFSDGTKMTDVSEWDKRRKELVDAVVPVLYGGMPPKPEVLKVTFLYLWRDHLATYLIEAGTKEKTVAFELQMYKPVGEKGPFPVLLTGDGCFGNFNDAVIAEANSRGYVVAKFNRAILARDDYDYHGREGGLYDVYPGMTFGAIAAWAWGYHRCVDALEQIPMADASCVAISGHSRGGKTTLLAAATDERILFAQDAQSGAGGGGCFRYEQYVAECEKRELHLEDQRSECMKDLKPIVEYWFGPEIWNYSGRETELPFDYHFLKAAVAPRWLLQSFSIDDIWSNPRGAYLTYKAAKEVYKFLGVEDRIAANYRRGPHAHRYTDICMFMDFVDAARAGQPFGGDNADHMILKQPDPDTLVMHK